MSESEKVKFVCCYRTGPKFNPEHIYKLKKQVSRHSRGQLQFTCLTNHPSLISEDWAIALERPEKKGWWCLTEKFRITGPVVFSGLDTIVLGSLLPFVDLAKSISPEDKTVYMIHPFRFPNKYYRLYANGMMVWNGDLSAIYNEYNYDVANDRYVLEQDYTSAQLIERGYNIRVLQNEITGIESFKRTCNKGAPPKGARIVLFHGKPGVEEVAATQEWAKKAWK